MLKALARFLNPASPSPAPAASRPQPTHEAPTPEAVDGARQHLDPGAPYFDGEAVPRWPEHGAAMVAASPDALLLTQADTITRIRGFSPLLPSQFESLVMPVFRRYAEWVHLLPASEAHHHFGAGGLLTHGLEVALHAARIADGKQVGIDLTPSARAAYQPRWKVATMLGGLFHDLGKPLVDCGATDPDRTITWSAHTGSLYQWLRQNQLTHYRFYWRSGARHERHKPVGTSVVREILGPEMLDWLCDEPTQDVVNLLMMAIAQGRSPSNLLAQIVHNADTLSVEADLMRLAERTRATGQGGTNSVAALIMSAMRELMEANKLEVNRAGGLVWVTTQGVFVSSPAIFNQLAPVLSRKNIHGLPASNGDIIDKLVEGGFLERAVVDEKASAVWKLTPTGLQSSLSLAEVDVLKMRNPAYLLGDLPMPSPLEVTVRAPFMSDADRAALAQAVTFVGEPQSADSALAAQPYVSEATVTAAPVAEAGARKTEPAPAEAAAAVDAGPHIESRRNRPDLANARSPEEQRKREANKAPDADVEELLAQLERAHLAGTAMGAILERIAAGALVWNRDVYEAEGELVLKLPVCFEGIGTKPDLMLNSAFSAGWIKTDEGNPGKVSNRVFPSQAREKCAIVVGLPYRIWVAIRTQHPGITSGQKVILREGDELGAPAGARADAPSATKASPPPAASSPTNPPAGAQPTPTRPSPQPAQAGHEEPEGRAEGRAPQDGQRRQPEPSGRPQDARPAKAERAVAGAAPAPDRDARAVPRQDILAGTGASSTGPKTEPAAAGAGRSGAPPAASSARQEQGIQRPGYLTKENGRSGSPVAADRITDLNPTKIELINGYCWLTTQRVLLTPGSEGVPAAVREALMAYAKVIKVRNGPLLAALSTPDNRAFLFTDPPSKDLSQVEDMRLNPEYNVPDWVQQKYESLRKELGV